MSTPQRKISPQAQALLNELFRDPVATRARVQAERARRSGSRSLEAFVKQAWPIFEGAPLVWNWHLSALSTHLEAVTERRITRLNVNLPPRAGKSNIFAICWPAWVWITQPQAQFLYLSVEEKLSIEHSIKCRQLVESDWYRTQFKVPWTFRDDQNIKGDFVNTQGGRRRALAVKGSIIGKGGDYICGDDLLNDKEAFSRVARDEAWRVWTQAVTTRMNNPQTGVAVLLGQRLHEDDPSGRVLKTGDYESFVVPNEFDPGKRCVTYHLVTRTNGHVEQVKEKLYEDPRTTEGELFFPQHLSREVTETAKRDFGIGPYMAQFGQAPIKATAGALWTPDVIQAGRVLVAPPLSRIIIAVDPSGSAKKTADEVGITVQGKGECSCQVTADGGKVEDHMFLLEDLSGRFDPETWGRRAVQAYLDWGADLIVAEDNFGGRIVQDVITLVAASMGVVVNYKAVHASRGKLVRAEPAAALYTGRRAHHVGVHPLLEVQLCSHSAGSKESPGRLDALVWGAHELMLGEGNASFGDAEFKAPPPTFGGGDRLDEDFA